MIIELGTHYKDGLWGVLNKFANEKEYDDFNELLADLPKYKDKIGKGYLVVQELVVTDDLEIETPEVVHVDGVALPKKDADDLYKSVYQSVFGTN